MPRPTRAVAAGLALLLLAACAQAPTPRAGQVVDRLPAAARPAPPPRLGLDDIARLAEAGEGPEAIIARLRGSGTRLRLSAADVLALKGRGVPLAVIDHLLDGERRAAADECSARINQRESDARLALEQAELLCRQRCSLACPPGGGWPGYRPPYWRPWP